MPIRTSSGRLTDYVRRPPGPQHGPGRRRQHRRRPAHGLHGGGRHDQRRGPDAAGGGPRPRGGLGGDVSSSRATSETSCSERSRSKGKAEAMPPGTWCRLTGAHAFRDRHRTGGLTPLVGRERELDLRRHRVRALGGGPGAARLRRRRGGDRKTACSTSSTNVWVTGHAALEGRCLSFGHAIPFHPLSIELLRRHFEIGESDPDAAIIAWIEAAVSRPGRGSPADHSVSPVAPRRGPRPVVSRMNPQSRREIVEAVARLIGRARSSSPGRRHRGSALDRQRLRGAARRPRGRRGRPAHARSPIGRGTAIRSASGRIRCDIVLSAQDTARIAEQATPRLPAELVEILAARGEGTR